MKHKLGPLQTWQWAAIGAAIGLVLYLRHRSSTSSTAVTTPGAAADTTSVGPVDPTTGLPYASTNASAIDPTTGLPYSSEGNLISTLLGNLQQTQAQSAPGATTNDTSLQTPPTLQGEITDVAGTLQSLQALQAFFTGEPLPHAQTPAGATGAAQVGVAAGQKNVGTAKPKPHPKPKPKHKAGSKNNPGHTITTHPNGRQTASSSAPASAHQHTNVAPPAHQVAPSRTRHPSGGVAFIAPTHTVTTTPTSHQHVTPHPNGPAHSHVPVTKSPAKPPKRRR